MPRPPEASTSSEPSEILAFGEFQLDVGRRELRRDGVPVELRPTPLRLLFYLAERRDRTIPKQELLDALWPDAIVTDTSLANALSEARRFVGDDGDVQRVIRTFKGHGYRFVAQVRKPTESRAQPSRPSAQMPFVGRSATLERLALALDDACGGSGRIALLAGEPGIGKTRTTEEFARHVREREVAVYTGWCDESGIAPPYWPWVRILRAVIDAAPADTLRTDLGSGVAVLARILPELRERWPDLPASADLGPELRFELLDAVSTFLQRTATRRPIVLIVDDLHRADEPSLALLTFLAHEVSDAPMLILATYRDVEVSRDHPLSTALGELSRQDICERLHLEGLPPNEVGELIHRLAGAEPRPELVEQVLARTDGNPFFIMELVRLIEAHEGAGWVSETSALSPEVPPRVREVVASRLRQLSPSCNEVLGVASVAGRDFALPVIQGASGLDADTLDHAIEEARRAGIVGTSPAGGPRFTHVVYQEAIYDDLPDGLRGRIHGRVAAVLEETCPPAILGEQAGVLANHWERAGQPIAAARWHRRAATWTGLKHPAETLRHWESVRTLAAQHLTRSDAHDLALTATIHLLDCYWRLGLPVEKATSIFAEGRALAEPERDWGALARLTANYSGIRGQAGDLDEGLALLNEAVQLADRAKDAKLKYRIEVDRLNAYGGTGLRREGIQRSDELLAVAPDDPAVLTARAFHLTFVRPGEVHRAPESRSQGSGGRRCAHREEGPSLLHRLDTRRILGES